MAVKIIREPLWEAMVPEGIREKFSDLKSALSYLEGEPTSKEAALALFWSIYAPQSAWDPEEYKYIYAKLKELPIEPSIEERLKELERRLRYPPYQPDEEDLPDPFVYLHIAGALMTIHKRREGYSERVEELIAEMERIYYSHKLYEYEWKEEDPFDRSLTVILGIEGLNYFELLDKEGRYLEALEQFNGGMHWLSITRGYDIYEIEMGEVIWKDELAERGSQQKPVKVFRKLYSNPPEEINWEDASRLCERILWNGIDVFDDPPPVVWKGEVIEWLFFWQYAAGLCASMLSLANYRKLRMEDLEYESERRLKSYFFRDTWNGLPLKVKGRLVNADKEWFGPERGDFGTILDHLKVATECLLYNLFFELFKDWFRKNIEKGEPTLLDFERLLQSPEFKGYLSRLNWLSPQEKVFLNQLPSNLKATDLCKLRANAEHRRREVKEQDIAPYFREYLGIGTQGILPQLAKIYQKSPYAKKPQVKR